MAAPFTILPNYNYEDYKSWNVKNWELIDGIPFAIQSVHDPLHQSMLEKVSDLLGKYLINPGFEIVSREELIIDPHTLLRPDILVYNKKNSTGPIYCLVVEVINENGIVTERIVKPSLYAVKNIRWYVILNLAEKMTEVYELTDRHYQLKQQGKDFSFEFDLEGCKANIDFREIW